ncbi:MAG TPA: DUF2851 family protein [Lentimicrobium sp.]|nr:DUF2851 family protein [Lentimicrobium sp.]
MTEAFLHYLWMNGLFTKPLTTTNNESIKVINPGFHNIHSGPDFSDARLEIAGTLWAGNVEIHLNSSDWFRHGHHNDEAYNNVALHVVYKDDAAGRLPGMPVCELEGRIDLELVKAFQHFINSPGFVPCIDILGSISQIDMNLWLERMLIEKLEEKADYIQDILVSSNNDWEEVLYRMLARSFGFSVNALPFEMLSRSLSWKILAHHAHNPFQIEALLFGQAGMLTHELTATYGQELFKEYTFLRKKFKLVPMQSSLWKFLRMRPVNFPTIRIAQFSSLLSKNAGILSAITKAHTVSEMMNLFEVQASEYWDDHFVFDKMTKGKPKFLGSSSGELLIMNAVLPFLFVYGSSNGDEQLCSRALALFDQLPGEKNSSIIEWQKAGINVSTSFNTQALMHMKKNYCDKRECLNCRIGNLVLKKISPKRVIV